MWNRLAVRGPWEGPLQLPPLGGFIVALLLLHLAPPPRPSETGKGPRGLLALQNRHGNKGLANPCLAG